MDIELIKWLIGAAGGVVIFLTGVVGFVLNVFFTGANQRISRIERGLDEAFKQLRTKQDNYHDGPRLNQ